MRFSLTMFLLLSMGVIFALPLVESEARSINASSATGKWSAAPSLTITVGPPGRAAGVLNDKLYIVTTTSMQVFDPSLNKWSGGPGRELCDGPGMGVLGGMLYAVGGAVVAPGSGACSGMILYDVKTSTWTQQPSMSQARQFFAVGVLGGNLYSVGGYDGNGAALKSMEIYDPSTNAWKLGPSMAETRNGHAVGVLGGKMYVVGGMNADGPPSDYLKTMEIFDPSTGSWSAGPSMKTGRMFFGVGVLDGMLYALGSDGADYKALASTEVFDPSSNKWTRGPSMLHARTSLVVATINGKLYAAGGDADSPSTMEVLSASDGALLE